MRTTSTHADLAHYCHAIHRMYVDDKRKMRNLNHLMVHFHFAMCFSLPSTVSFLYISSRKTSTTEREGGGGGRGEKGRAGAHVDGMSGYKANSRIPYGPLMVVAMV